MINIAHINGQSCPVAYCDHCNERITQAGDALYTWPRLEDEAKRIVLFIHKRCLPAFEHERGERWPDQELKGLPRLFGFNLHIGVSSGAGDDA